VKGATACRVLHGARVRPALDAAPGEPSRGAKQWNGREGGPPIQPSRPKRPLRRTGGPPSLLVARSFAYDVGVIVDRLDIGAEEFERATGWEIKPEGACKADVCVPLPDGGFDLMAAAERLGMAVVADPGTALWALGPETLGGRALATADASDFSLPDLDGNTFQIASLRNQKVVVVAWAPY
jgi:hypothetical protein